MSKDLHIAIQEAINSQGTDVLRSPFLVNILQDYGAFDIHDCNSSIAKRKLSELINKGEIEEILSWRGLSKERQQRKWQKLLVKYKKDDVAQMFFDNILIALKIPHANLQVHNSNSRRFASTQSLNAKNSKNNSTRSIINAKYANVLVKLFPGLSTSNEPLALSCRNFLSTIKKWIQSTKDSHKILRIILYIVTVWNVIQLLSGIERVITWSVWYWGDFFDIIGIPLGIIGFTVGVLLPAFVVAYMCHVIEFSNRVNLKKTNALLVILNMAGVYGLFVMTKTSYTISETHYGNFREYTNHIDYTLWSWNHIWVIIRPLVYLIVGIVAIILVLLVFRVILQALCFIGHTLTKFFTS